MDLGSLPELKQPGRQQDPNTAAGTSEVPRQVTIATPAESLSPFQSAFIQVPEPSAKNFKGLTCLVMCLLLYTIK